MYGSENHYLSALPGITDRLRIGYATSLASCRLQPWAPMMRLSCSFHGSFYLFLRLLAPAGAQDQIPLAQCGARRENHWMMKEVNCSNCCALLRVEGPVQSNKEHSEGITCPACGTPNEIDWPTFSGAITITIIDANNGRNRNS